MTTELKGKKVVLLGGAALIGSHLARALLDEGIVALKVVDDLSSGRIENIEDLMKQGVQFIQSDLRYYSNAEKEVQGFDIVFHLAAQHGGRGYVAGHAVELWDNLSLDTTIFRACSQAGVEKVIFSSSACAYPVDVQTNPKEVFYLKEDLIDYSRLLPADGPYGTEKLVGEAMLDAYVARGDFKGCSTRSFTVYGPLMKESHAIAALIAKVMLRQEPLEIWGDGNQVRNWTHVTDNVQGAILAAKHVDRGAINVGVEDRLTPNIALYEICGIMGWYPAGVHFMTDKPVGPRNRVADSSKLKALGWSPKFTFREGLRQTIDWYLSTHTAEEVQKDFERKLTER